MAAAGIRADFDIARFKRAWFGPIATCAPAAAPPSQHIECKVVQHQCDYLHLVISSPFALFRCLSSVSFSARQVRAVDYLTQQYGQNSPPFELTRKSRTSAFRMGTATTSSPSIHATAAQSSITRA
jgi:hypothetical protein